MTKTVTATTPPASSQLGPEPPLIEKVSRLFDDRVKTANQSLDQTNAPAPSSDSQHAVTARLSALTMRWISEEGRLLAEWTVTQPDSGNANEFQTT